MYTEESGGVIKEIRNDVIKGKRTKEGEAAADR